MGIKSNALIHTGATHRPTEPNVRVRGMLAFAKYRIKWHNSIILRSQIVRLIYRLRPNPSHGHSCDIVSFHWGPLIIFENKVTGEGFCDALIPEPSPTQIGDKNGVI